VEENMNAYKPEGKRPLGRPRRRWEDNIKMDLREIGWGGMDWIDLIGTSGELLYLYDVYICVFVFV
jgi:hypothetical protein